MLEHLLEGEVDARTLEEVIHAIARGVRDHEDRVGIRAEEHEARLTEREQAGKAVEQVHGHGDERVHRTLFDDRKEQGAGRHHILQYHRHEREREHDGKGDQVAAACFFVFRFQHSDPPPLRLCPWPFHRTGRWA